MPVTVNLAFVFFLSYTKINNNTKNKTKYLQTYGSGLDEQGLDEFDIIKLWPLIWDTP